MIAGMIAALALVGSVSPVASHQRHAAVFVRGSAENIFRKAGAPSPFPEHVPVAVDGREREMSLASIEHAALISRPWTIVRKEDPGRGGGGDNAQSGNLTVAKPEHVLFRRIGVNLREAAQFQIVSRRLPSVGEQYFVNRPVSRLDVSYFNPAHVDIRPQLPFGRLARDLVGFAGFRERSATLPQVQDKPKNTGNADQHRPERPPCSLTSGVCGLPLSAKIGASAILAWLAWALQFRGLTRLGLFGDVPRKRLYGIGEVAGSLGLFGLCAFIWWWGSTY